jgi:hypothetical protein
VSKGDSCRFFAKIDNCPADHLSETSPSGLNEYASIRSSSRFAICPESEAGAQIAKRAASPIGRGGSGEVRYFTRTGANEYQWISVPHA